MPLFVENLKLFLAILDLASLAWMPDWISASESLEAGTATRLWAGGPAGGRVWGWAARVIAKRTRRSFIPYR